MVAAVSVIAIGSLHVGAIHSREKMRQEAAAQSAKAAKLAGLALKGVVIKPEDDLNLAVYNETAEELLNESADTDATSDLEAFPRALTRYTGQL